MTDIVKYSDYAINTVNYFADLLETAVNYRDIKGLSNGQIDFIVVTKEHPLVTMMATKLGESRNADLLRSNLLPAIAVTPGSADPQDFGFGLSQSDRIITDADITEYKRLYNLPDNKSLQTLGLISKDQLSTIMSAYKRLNGSIMKCHSSQWGRNEEVNVSCWSETPDVDCLMDNVVNSVLADIRAKMPGDNSPLRNMKFKTTRGLTNFNFGRVLYGSEYSLTFLNIYNNYSIYVEQSITDVTLDLTYQTPGQVI